MGFLRVLGAAVFVLTCGAMASLLAIRIAGEDSVGIIAVASIGSLFCALAIAVWMFNPRGQLDAYGQSVLVLQEKGLLESRAFTALRAFQVEELEDEGLHYFLELTDGSVLFLSGQYLYDYEDQFPCTEFVVRRHRIEDYGIDIHCSGEVLKPEVVAPPFELEEYESDRYPGDGAIITDMSYEAVKAARIAR